MNADLLFEACSYIDEDFLHKSEKKRPNIPMLSSAVAIMVVALLGISFLFPNNPTLQNHSISCYPDNLWTITYNRSSTTADSSASASLKRNYYCLYGQKLTTEEVGTLSPCSGFSDIDCKGTAIYGPVGLEWVEINVNDPTLSPITARLSKKQILQPYDTQDAVVSEVGGENGVQVIAYESASEDFLDLYLTFQLNKQLHIELFATASKEEEVQMKQRLSDIIAAYVIDKKELDLDFITSSGTPDIRREELTLSEAQKDSEFGAYFLKELPQGFKSESITRLYHPESAGLYGLWTKYYYNLDWSVSYFKDTDQSRLTSVKDAVNYDLSLYPIPRADSVPEELREMVDNPIFKIEELTLETVKKRSYRIADAGDTNGERMHFSVLYGDILVEISAKGVDSDWVYEQLTALK